MTDKKTFEEYKQSREYQNRQARIEALQKDPTATRTQTTITSKSKKIEFTTKDPNAFDNIVSQRRERLEKLRNSGNKTVIVDKTPSKVDSNTGTATYGSKSWSKKVDGKSLIDALERDAATSELSNVLRQAAEDKANRRVTGSQSADSPRVVEVEKTPAPAELTETTKNAYKQLIETNPPGQEENIKQIKEKFSDVTTEDGTPLGEVVPQDLSELSEEAQKQAIHFKDALENITIPDSLTTGKLVIQADPFKDTTLDTMQAKIENTFKELKSPLAAGNSAMDIAASLKNASDVLSGQMGSMVSNMTDQLTDKIMGSVNVGLIAEQDRITNLSDVDFAKEFSGKFSSRLAAVKEFQRPFFESGSDGLGPGIVENLLDTIGCEPSQIGEALPGMFNDLLGSAMGNMVNTPSCAGQQIIGAATNKVVNMIDSVMKPKLEGIEKALNFKLDVKDMLFSGLNMKSVSSKVPELNVCGTKPATISTNKFLLGMGPKLPSSVAKIQSSFNEILDSSAIKNKVSGIAGQVSDFQKEYGSWGIFGGDSTGGTPLDNCNTGPVESSGSPIMEAFGGGGSGLKTAVILGNFVNRLNPDDIFAPAERTASIVGVRIINSGRGYTSPPIVTFEDGIGQGYGAYGKATVDQNPNSPTYGQVTSISITSKGENYPAPDEEDPMYIGGVVIDDPGLGYEDTDTLEDFELTVVDGQIVNVNVVNHKTYNDLPELNINTTTGFGAKLRPLLTLIAPSQGEVIQVIDCIGKV